jgi:iron complex transport system substrate-binding protein
VRIVSLLPSATEMLFALGAGPQIVGVSHECKWPAQAAVLPKVTGTTVDVRAASREIDKQVSGALAAGESIYTTNDELLLALRPDLVITQQLCEVCAITPSGVQQTLAQLRPAPEVLSLHPHSIGEIFEDVLAVGRSVSRGLEAVQLVDGFKRRLASVESAVAGRGRPRVYCMEWLDPPYNAGHWVPEQVRIAGGEDGLGRLGNDSVRLMWDRIVEYDPEVLVLMPCGLSIARMQSELGGLVDERWMRLSAVRTGRVFGVNGPAYFNNSGPRVVDGAELLASILHPDAVTRRFGFQDVCKLKVASSGDDA